MKVGSEEVHWRWHTNSAAEYVEMEAMEMMMARSTKCLWELEPGQGLVDRMKKVLAEKVNEGLWRVWAWKFRIAIRQGNQVERSSEEENNYMHNMTGKCQGVVWAVAMKWVKVGV